MLKYFLIWKIIVHCLVIYVLWHDIKFLNTDKNLRISTKNIQLKNCFSLPPSQIIELPALQSFSPPIISQNPLSYRLLYGIISLWKLKPDASSILHYFPYTQRSAVTFRVECMRNAQPLNCLTNILALVSQAHITHVCRCLLEGKSIFRIEYWKILKDVFWSSGMQVVSRTTY